MNKRADKIKAKDVPNLKTALFSAIGGNVSQAIVDIGKLDQDQFSELEKGIVEKYEKRFGKKSKLPLATENDLALQVIGKFQGYWKKALLGELKDEEGYKYLFEQLVPLAEVRGYKSESFGEKEFERLGEFLKAELKKDGYYTLFGRVKPLLNIMIWRKEYESDYNVKIGDNEMQKVSVVFMDDFLELGWGAFATFDIMYVGGWATKDKLYCVKPAYDVDSESFHVSYLAHEGRHFSDYKLFPKLDQIDLEYRAKLTEIVVSDKTYEEVIDKFIHEQKNDRKAPHAYASYLLVQGLLGKLEKGDLQGSDRLAVQTAAKELIVEHAELAQSKGSGSVQSVF